MTGGIGALTRSQNEVTFAKYILSVNSIQLESVIFAIGARYICHGCVVKIYC